MNIAVITTKAKGAQSSSVVGVVLGIQGPAGPDVWADVPASPDAPGSPGQKAYDGSYLYLCVALNTWKRVAIATWVV